MQEERPCSTLPSRYPSMEAQKCPRMVLIDLSSDVVKGVVLQLDQHDKARTARTNKSMRDIVYAAWCKVVIHEHIKNWTSIQHLRNLTRNHWQRARHSPN